MWPQRSEWATMPRQAAFGGDRMSAAQPDHAARALAPADLLAQRLRLAAEEAGAPPVRQPEEGVAEALVGGADSPPLVPSLLRCTGTPQVNRVSATVLSLP